ncbi:MAG: hypothetical protein GFH27_549361n52 [Chloroflexi bacterium AL-W]|nr:hypothetical protein [Chloroflexi bacterium AL-N1]NOK70764.1 hypothetical protein [Chloroflexi bacterium AL-N10]NOK78324.1 hypothetical protein [Chloroflexi bacterium AL-N5]NOK85667.1 hypothetical protein [Chloroflexi bacterium AL-W]NOK92581.1 hypothetical protein [Chloroflexi bacterium AL-N15]
MMNHICLYKPQDMITIELDALKIDTTELSTRRRFIIGAGGLLGVALAGCGQSTPEPARIDGPTRTIEHALGTAEVPETPQRVIACDYYFTLPTAIQLEIPVVGVPFGAAQALPDWVATIAPEDVTDIGTNVAPNLERMSSLQPDLIIGFDFFLEPIYNEVTAIAPTVALPREMLNGGWKNGVRKLAEAFGQQEAMEQKLSDYEQRAQSIQQSLSAETANKTYSLTRVLDSELRIHTDLHFGGSVMEDIGLSRPSDHINGDTERPLIRLTLEQIERVDADALFLLVGGGGQHEGALETFETLQQNALWQQLQAVQNDAVYQVSEYWSSGELHAANLILDDIDEYLAS